MTMLSSGKDVYYNIHLTIYYLHRTLIVRSKESKLLFVEAFYCISVYNVVIFASACSVSRVGGLHICMLKNVQR